MGRGRRICGAHPALVAAATLALGGCLSAPEGPSGGRDGGTNRRDGGGGSDGGGDGTLVLTGVAGRDFVNADQQDDLVLIGTRDGKPRAIVLLGSDSTPEALQVAREIALPSMPKQVVLAPWSAATGAALLLDEDGAIFVFDARLDGVTPLVLERPTGYSDLPTSAMTLVQFGASHRLLISDDDRLWITDALGGAEPPGDMPLPIEPLHNSGEVFLLESHNYTNRTFVGLVHGPSLGIDVFEAADGTPPALMEMAVEQSTPSSLERPLWQSLGGPYLHLIGIVPSGPELYVHTTPVNGEPPSATSALEGVYDAIHDLLITRVAGDKTDLVVLGTVDGKLVVHVYGDPASGLVLGTPASWSPPADSGFRGPGWLQAMECVGTEPGVNEIVLYDADGHLFCLRVDAEDKELKIRDVGSIDLGAADLGAAGG
ncbi:MAG TPA: hypothetical protein VKZ63_02500 [Kofleriaceae bacterium]|nr:hypothetical protein [Kofleriaceae bacterium]